MTTRVDWLHTWLAASLLLIASVGTAHAAKYLNKEVEITGHWRGGRIEVSSIQVPKIPKGSNTGQISGTIARVEPAARRFYIGPVAIQWSRRTEFEGLAPPVDLVVGRSVRVSGRIAAPGRLAASTIRARSAYGTRIKLRSTVTSETKLADRSLRVTLLGIQVRVPKKVVGRATTLIRRPDDRRPKDQFSTVIAGRPLTIGGEYNFEFDDRVDFELGADFDDITRIDQELQLEFFYPFTEEVSLFAELKALDQREIDAEDPARDRDLRTNTQLQRGEMWLFVDRLFSPQTGLQLGRQDFREKREWWWDEDLDAVRFYYDEDDVHLQIALAQELAKISNKQDFIDPEQEDVTRILGNLVWQWRKRQLLELYFLDQHDGSSDYILTQVVTRDEEDEVDGDFTWFGARARGKIKFKHAGRLLYWLDTAWVTGEETDYDFDPVTREVDDIDTIDVDGSAFDLGASWSTRLPGRPAFTLGYARGSGDATAGDGVDKAFRQTGLQDNNGRFHGVNRFRYYGELLRPELSNLEILTLAYGQPLGVRSSLEVVYHRYQQVHADNDVRDARLRIDPNGIDTDIGEELDFVLGFRKWQHVDIEAVLGLFRAGDAYGVNSGDTARFMKLEFTYNF